MNDLTAQDILALMRKFDELGYHATRQIELLTVMFENIVIEGVSDERKRQWENQQNQISFHEE